MIVEEERKEEIDSQKRASKDIYEFEVDFENSKDADSMTSEALDDAIAEQMRI